MRIRSNIPDIHRLQHLWEMRVLSAHVAMAAFRHRDPDFALDLLSTNRRFQPYTELAVLGTVVVAGTTRESIQVLIPHCTIPPVDNDVVIDLQHVVELSLGASFDMGKELPPPDLAAALCPNLLDPTLGLGRRDYWEEMNALLAECKQLEVPGMSPDYQGQHVVSSPPCSHVRLEVSGASVPLVDFIGTEWQPQMGIYLHIKCERARLNIFGVSVHVV